MVQENQFLTHHLICIDSGYVATGKIVQIFSSKTIYLLYSYSPTLIIYRIWPFLFIYVRKLTMAVAAGLDIIVIIKNLRTQFWLGKKKGFSFILIFICMYMFFIIRLLILYFPTICWSFFSVTSQRKNVEDTDSLLINDLSFTLKWAGADISKGERISESTLFVQ